jgi:hypothetical protein
MKNKLILFIILISLIESSFAQGTSVGYQYRAKRWLQIAQNTHGTYQGVSTNGIEITGLEYIPSGTPPPQGWPVIIFKHGIGERGGYQSPVDRADTLQFCGADNTSCRNDASCDALMTTTPFSLLKYSSSSLAGRLYWDPLYNRWTEVAWIGVQCYGDDTDPYTWGWSKWPPVYTREVIRRIRVTHKGKLDPTRIYSTGLSLGGGGAGADTHDSLAAPFIAASQWNCMGYPETERDDFAYIAREGMPIRLFHATNDAITLPTGATQSINYYNNLRAQNPIWQPELYIYTEGDAQSNHNIWDRMYSPAKWGITYNLTNGGTFDTDVQGGFVEWFLQFRTDPNGGHRGIYRHFTYRRPKEADPYGVSFALIRSLNPLTYGTDTVSSRTGLHEWSSIALYHKDSDVQKEISNRSVANAHSQNILDNGMGCFSIVNSVSSGLDILFDERIGQGTVPRQHKRVCIHDISRHGLGVTSSRSICVWTSEPYSESIRA